jgi:transglutaminase-like putative cysteine protease
MTCTKFTIRLLIILLASGLAFYFYSHSKEAAPAQLRQLRYTFLVSNLGNRPLNDFKIKIATPLESFTSQKRIKLSLQNEQLHSMAGANSTALTLSLPPYGKRSFSIAAEVGTFSEPRFLNAAVLPETLASSQFVQSDALEIRTLASQLMGKTPTETAKRIFDWQLESLAASHFTREHLGALTALSTRQGDCTEFAYLFAALARSNKVPARIIAGFVAEKDKVLKPGEFHNWAEFYDGRVWRIADANRKVFDAGYESYIAFGVLAEGSSTAPVAEPFSLVSSLSPEVKDLLEIEMGGGAK